MDAIPVSYTHLMVPKQIAVMMTKIILLLLFMIATSSHLIVPSTPSYYNSTAEICKIYIHYSYYAYLILSLIHI